MSDMTDDVPMLLVTFLLTLVISTGICLVASLNGFGWMPENAVE